MTEGMTGQVNDPAERMLNIGRLGTAHGDGPEHYKG